MPARLAHSSAMGTKSCETGRVLRRVSRQAAWPKGAEMDRQVAGVLYGVVMAAVIVGVDVAFFRGRFWERLMVNVGIVLVFGAFYLRFFRPS